MNPTPAMLPTPVPAAQRKVAIICSHRHRYQSD